MKIENIKVYNFEGALRGMRNPKNSWLLNDSTDEIVGPNDLKLAKTLIKAGPEHRKFLRQIFVSMDIEAPLYFWKEMDQYKVGTTTDSCSTMHKLSSTPINLNCFEIDDFDKDILNNIETGLNESPATTIINICENLRQEFLRTQDIRYWKELIRWLPESWLQKRTWTGDYEILRNIYNQRHTHKLSEWHYVCNQIATMPYAKEFIIGD